MAFKDYGDLVGDGLTEQDFRDYIYRNYREVAEVWWGQDALQERDI
jgi:hypothetical protein